MGRRPGIDPGERVYSVFNGKVRGYAPLVRVEVYTYSQYWDGPPTTRYALVRHGAAAAVTIDADITGLQGFRYQWWDREVERPFPDWRHP